ncbi:hypothetical protein D3C72_1033440 [compost metagenome]
MQPVANLARRRCVEFDREFGDHAIETGSEVEWTLVIGIEQGTGVVRTLVQLVGQLDGDRTRGWILRIQHYVDRNLATDDFRLGPGDRDLDGKGRRRITAADVAKVQRVFGPLGDIPGLLRALVGRHRLGNLLRLDLLHRDGDVACTSPSGAEIFGQEIGVQR